MHRNTELLYAVWLCNDATEAKQNRPKEESGNAKRCALENRFSVFSTRQTPANLGKHALRLTRASRYRMPIARI